jgi:uncharacterized membrane protein YraQ (UPF0718 family)/YHS domain-containing protein
VILAVAWIVDIGHSLREGFFMFWETLWALILGFGLSGAVQAFVPKESMQRVLGSRSPAAVAKASGFGMVSSSCSYAATAMAKSLFQKGADFISAMVFMFASTNLVIELGIVMLILLGWQFTAGEFVGGPIMIVLLVALGGLVLGESLIAGARRHARSTGSTQSDHDHETMAGVSPDRQIELDSERLRTKLTSKADWADAASYAVGDLTMLRKELVIGYTVAGFLAVLVPLAWWNKLFLHGHGFWTSLENALVGPIIAVLSWVCSIGNVPLAAALWHGGISFGGVIAFIFADLIAMPLILIYRKYYGGLFTLRLVGLFYVVMVLAGLAVGGIFTAAGIVPAHPTGGTISPTHFEWNYTTFLNILFLVAGAWLYWLYRSRHRLGGGVAYAIDPVCGMQVRIADAPARISHDGVQVHFCSDHCRERYQASLPPPMARQDPTVDRSAGH